ncbi:hypothetical protein D3C71_961240 [compost metagenome]
MLAQDQFQLTAPAEVPRLEAQWHADVAFLGQAAHGVQVVECHRQPRFFIEALALEFALDVAPIGLHLPDLARCGVKRGPRGRAAGPGAEFAVQVLVADGPAATGYDQRRHGVRLDCLRVVDARVLGFSHLDAPAIRRIDVTGVPTELVDARAMAVARQMPIHLGAAGAGLCLIHRLNVLGQVGGLVFFAGAHVDVVQRSLHAPDAGGAVEWVEEDPFLLLGDVAVGLWFIEAHDGEVRSNGEGALARGLVASGLCQKLQLVMAEGLGGTWEYSRTLAVCPRLCNAQQVLEVLVDAPAQRCNHLSGFGARLIGAVRAVGIHHVRERREQRIEPVELAAVEVVARQCMAVGGTIGEARLVDGHVVVAAHAFIGFAARPRAGGLELGAMALHGIGLREGSLRPPRLGRDFAVGPGRAGVVFHAFACIAAVGRRGLEHAEHERPVVLVASLHACADAVGHLVSLVVAAGHDDGYLVLRIAVHLAHQAEDHHVVQAPRIEAAAFFLVENVAQQVEGFPLLANPARAAGFRHGVEVAVVVDQVSREQHGIDLVAARGHRLEQLLESLEAVADFAADGPVPSCVGLLEHFGIAAAHGVLTHVDMNVGEMPQLEARLGHALDGVPALEEGIQLGFLAGLAPAERDIGWRHGEFVELVEVPGIACGLLLQEACDGKVLGLGVLDALEGFELSVFGAQPGHPGKAFHGTGLLQIGEGRGRQIDLDLVDVLHLGVDQGRCGGDRGEGAAVPIADECPRSERADEPGLDARFGESTCRAVSEEGASLCRPFGLLSLLFACEVDHTQMLVDQPVHFDGLTGGDGCLGLATHARRRGDEDAGLDLAGGQQQRRAQAGEQDDGFFFEHRRFGAVADAGLGLIGHGGSIRGEWVRCPRQVAGDAAGNRVAKTWAASEAPRRACNGARKR